jgi:NAD(P)-dependent dehydrogenase (short-subunit alcohol dehydrogenase family)
VDPAAVRHVFKDVISKFGVIHVLVLNAGYASEYNTIAGSRLEDYWYLFEVNVKGPLIATKEFLKTVAPIYSSQSESPTIINITSGAAHLRYLRGFSAYSAAKLATIKAMEYVHLETPGVRVFNLQPGIINTDMLRKAQRIKKEAEDDISKLSSRFPLSSWPRNTLLNVLNICIINTLILHK